MGIQMFISGILIKVKKKHYSAKDQKASHSHYDECNMLHDHTFQHRARISILIENFKPLNNKANIFKHTVSSNHSVSSTLPVSQLTRKKISLSKKGKKLKKKVAFKISNSLRGRSLTDKHKSNLKWALSGIKNPMFGRLHSKYVRITISKSLIKKVDFL